MKAWELIVVVAVLVGLVVDVVMFRHLFGEKISSFF